MEVQLFDIGTGLFIWFLVTLLLLVLAPAGVGAYVAARRGRPAFLGFVAGLVLSWIGVVLVLLVMKPGTPATPTGSSAG